MTNEIQTRHPMILVEVGAWRDVIDIELAPLISEIWRAGIETFMSCQETRPGIAWIEFGSMEDVLEFINLVAHYEPGVDTLYNRIRFQLTGKMSSLLWEFQVNFLDLWEEQPEQIEHGCSLLEATIGVYFPRSDIPLLLDRLRERNQCVDGS